ncbi:MAG: DUF1376 domain-containing protein [Candidatus Babeliales bacterium]|jgi:hypothetical protein
MKTKDPAFLFYSKDWIEGTAEYMPEEKGVYIDLLCFQHQRGGIPIETVRLAKMVGLPEEQFIKIWSVISDHFEVMDNRLVNRKLYDLMTDRSSKSLTNTISGTFAGLLRNGNFNKNQYNYLKKHFNIDDFIELGKERLTERITEWIQKRLKSIEDENENENGDENIINNRKRKPFKKPTIQEVRTFFIDNGYDPDFGESRWHYYNDADWFDSKGNPVLNWKQKMRSVWFKPENKKKSEPYIPPVKLLRGE